MTHFVKVPYVQTLEVAAKSLLDLKGTMQIKGIDPLDLLQLISGYIAVTGFGKSGLIARKFVATLNSISIPSIFINAGDATHGDIGVLTKKDVIIFISKNGSNPDLLALYNASVVKTKYTMLITCNTKASLADKVDSCVILPIEKEADDFDLIPTHSTLCQMAFCDALAIGLMRSHKVSKAQFGSNHPSGNIGAINFCAVGDLLDDQQPSVRPTASIPEVITSISKSRKGATVVINEDGIIGIITDGDLRRMLEGKEDINTLTANDILTNSPHIVNADILASEAYKILFELKIHQLIVLKDGAYSGLIHFHQLVAKGFDR